MHYFCLNDQTQIIENVYNSLKPNSYFLLKAVILQPENLTFFLKLDKLRGIEFMPTFKDNHEFSIMNQLKKSNFKEIRNLGEIITRHISSTKLNEFYNLDDDKIKMLHNAIREIPKEKLRDFTINKNSFTLLIKYNVFLAQKI